MAESDQYSIYVLVDPRDQSIRYVGRTLNLKQRYRDHLPPSSYTTDEKRLWLIALRAVGLKPEMKVIDTTFDRSEALTKETQWIQHYTEAGSELFNRVSVDKREWARKTEEWARASKERYGQ